MTQPDEASSAAYGLAADNNYLREQLVLWQQRFGDAQAALLRREPIFELLVAVPSLEVKVGRFRRVLLFSLELAEPMAWNASQGGPPLGNGELPVTVGPTDWTWHMTGPARFSGQWSAGDQIVLSTLTLTPTLPTGPEIPRVVRV